MVLIEIAARESVDRTETQVHLLDRAPVTLTAVDRNGQHSGEEINGYEVVQLVPVEVEGNQIDRLSPRTEGDVRRPEDGRRVQDDKLVDVVVAVVDRVTGEIVDHIRT